MSLQAHIVADGGIYALLGPYAIANLEKECRLQASMVVDPPVPRFIALAMSPHGEMTLACRTVMQLTNTTVLKNKALFACLQENYEECDSPQMLIRSPLATSSTASCRDEQNQEFKDTKGGDVHHIRAFDR
ncbi:hypothetical protein P3T23_007501 [Paraburkholderia sp. GAS448]|uniref:hypothetical protein n=1 Tax=Paraburkholderia sp. GAS448 TaxID=3035136 RepID=UPI003D1C50DF